MPPKKSPQKKVKTVLSQNDDDFPKKIIDKSHEKESLKKSNNLLINGLDQMNESEHNFNEDMSTDEDEQLSPFKNKAVITDNYFMAQSTRSKTSKNSFAKLLQNFDLNEERIKEIVDDHFAEEREQLIDSYAEDKSLDKWFRLLNSGFNVCLYGVGSKRKVIDLFVSRYLQSRHRIVIHGFNGETTIRHITSVLSQVVGELITDETKLIDKLAEIDFNLYLIIHSIDVLLTTNPKIKSFLNHVVRKCSRLRIMATVDHINSGLLWSSTETDLYNWLWFNVPTFESYTIEKAFSTGLSLMSSSSSSWNQSVNYSAVKHVYDSLTPNAQKIFLLILSNYMESKDPNSGFSFTECYTVCREEFLVNSEQTLRSNLSEFKDHNLLKLKKGVDGGEVIVVCVDKMVAQKFLDNHK